MFYLSKKFIKKYPLPKLYSIYPKKINNSNIDFDVDSEKEFWKEKRYENYINNSSYDVFQHYKKIEGETKQEPLYNIDNDILLQQSLKKLKDLNSKLINRGNSVIDIDNKNKTRFRLNNEDDKRINKDDRYPIFDFVRKEFIFRINELGLNAKTFYDNEIRYEALKRSYFRYRRKRKYQKLAEMGITNRRPRRVTKEQYERFQIYLKTGKYPYGKSPGPVYVKGKKNILVRKDIYDKKINKSDTIERMAIWDNMPNIVKQKDDIIDIKDLENVDSFSIDRIGNLLKEKVFETWEEKLNWLFAVMKRLEYSKQACEALKGNLLTRLKVLKVYDNKTNPTEYEQLSESKLFSPQYSPRRGNWEEKWIAGFISRIEQKIEHYDKKRLLVKSEIDQNQYKHTDSFIEDISHRVRKDAETDEDTLHWIKTNPFKNRFVVNGSLLQRNQRRLANPDIFMRFEPTDWRNIEKEVMILQNRREEANRLAEALFDDEDLGAHRLLIPVFDEVENANESEREKLNLHNRLMNHAMLVIPRIRWARNIINGLSTDYFESNLWYNPYTMEQINEMERLFNSRMKSYLIFDPFPINNVDLDPSQFESEYLEHEKTIDWAFGKQAVSWFLSPMLERQYGHAYNPFRRFWPPVNYGKNYVTKYLPPNDKIDRGKIKNICYYFVCNNVVSHKKKGGEINTYKSLWLAGNQNGCAGFGIGKGPTDEESRNKAMENAKNYMIHVPRYRDVSLFHNLTAKWKGTVVKLLAVPPGFGIIGPPLLRSIIECVGIKDVTCFFIGNNNPTNIVKACFIALAKATDLDTVAWTRGRNLTEICGEIDGNSYHLPRDFYVSNLNSARKYLYEYGEKYVKTI